MNYQLLCTFADYRNAFSTLNEILNTHKIRENRIFIFESMDSTTKTLYYTYNIDTNELNYDFHSDSPNLKDTILIHRKKETNTFYTINALNELIAQLNNGVLDKNYIIPWENYKNTFILSNSVDRLKIIPVKLTEIFCPEK